MNRLPMSLQKSPNGNWTHWLIEGARASGRTHAALECCRRFLHERGADAHIAILATSPDSLRYILDELTSTDEWLFGYRRNAGGRRVSTSAGGIVQGYVPKDIEHMRGMRFNLFVLDNIEQYDQYNDIFELIELSAAPDAKFVVIRYKPPWLIYMEQQPGFVATTFAVSPNPVRV